MTYSEALQTIEKNRFLLGKRIDNATIDELIIVPVEHETQEKFLSLYRNILDGEKAIIPFINYDVEILVVFNKHWIRTENVFIWTSLESVLNKII